MIRHNMYHVFFKLIPSPLINPLINLCYEIIPESSVLLFSITRYVLEVYGYNLNFII